jgi:hypothetical protein
MLQLKVNVAQIPDEPDPETQYAKVSVAVDTTRNWINYIYELGRERVEGSSSAEAMTVSQARSSAGAEDVWISGYIVGGDLTSSSASFSPPFSSRTNIVLGPRSSVSSRSSCLAVSLPSGEIRDDLNLVDNPSLLGRKVVVRGDIVGSYYGLPGLKNLTDFELR